MGMMSTMVLALKWWFWVDITETIRSRKTIIFAIQFLREKFVCPSPDVGEPEENTEVENTEKD